MIFEISELGIDDSKSGEHDRFTYRIVTYAKELTSVYIYHSTGEGFNTSLSGFITHT